MTTSSKPSALESLKALAGKKPVDGASVVATQLSDPAIAGAKRNKNTVTLGFDPGMAPKAAHCAQLKQALEEADTAYKAIQAEIRDYGRGKRDLFNSTYKADVTTVCVPFFVDVQGKQETRLVQVICANKYSVDSETILKNRNEIGECFDSLFHVEEVKSLKPNAEDLIRGVFQEVGLSGDELDAAMANLLDVKRIVKTKEDYESQSKKAPDAVRSILDVTVTRAQPSIKFP